MTAAAPKPNPAAPAPPTSLEPHETYSPELWEEPVQEPSGCHPDYQLAALTREEWDFRHSGWRHERRAAIRAMAKCCPSTRRERFNCCGSQARILSSRDGQTWKIVANYCRDRLCIPCGIARGREIADCLTQRIGSRTLFVTLTLRHSRTPLTDQLDRLYRSFAALRRRQFWPTGAGGAAFLEIKLSRNDGCWHPHLHVLMDADWLAQKTLSDNWHAVTGDSSIVDVRRVSNPGEAARYVAKYVGKPCDTSVYHDQDRLQEFIGAMRGRRLCLTFGPWRGTPLKGTPDPKIAWVDHGSLADIIAAARQGDESAAFILKAVRPICPNVLISSG